ncbi:MAG TPA: glycosyltransferase family A protein [Pyrinomonadaceae bacterium]|jgi:glycosyltransferase involved in cell wall biosynthesis|nr:glycosyltransferase family A protein [Pyrinomonadaceae bacterium]
MDHSNKNRPLVNIGLAVFEEERFLRLTLQSLLAQDYPNFNLVICDNASTDGTRGICEEFAANDVRVQYYRAESNLGNIANFNRAFELAHGGKYFMWAGGHDLWEPAFISSAVAVLEANPEVILVYPRAILIDDEGRHHDAMPDDLDTRGLLPLSRYLKFIWNVQSCNMFHGLIRRDTLAQTELLRPTWGCDITLLSELALKGEFERLEQVMFYRRDFRPEEQEDVEQWKTRALKTTEGQQPSKRQTMTVEDLYRELRREQLRVITRSNLSPGDKLKARVQTIRWARNRFNVRLPADVAFRLFAGLRSPRMFASRVRARLQKAPRSI